MAKAPTISDFTWSTLQLKLWWENVDDETSTKKVASGFFWRYGSSAFLITNWHVLSGIDPIQGMTVRDPPTKLEVGYWTVDKTSGHEFDTKAVFHRTKHDLYHNSQPIWREHSAGRSVDIAAIKFDFVYTDEFREFCINDIDFHPNFHPRVAQDCFIIGYPEGLKGPKETPIWKRASIASEPEMDYDGKFFLVDSVSNSGMSGSPVIVQDFGLNPPNASGVVEGIGGWASLLGVYAGRMGENGVKGQLGRVWRTELIDEICSNNATVANPHQ